MNYVPKMNRRSFLTTAAAVGGGLAVGLDIPLGGPQVIRAADGSPEMNAWVVIKPDDTVVIRVVRAEMGQGSLTGLAQLVAEELDCDWAKVTTEVPTPGQSLARKRVYGNFNATGSRSIRESQEYVRKGGATAREMLKQAAANEWKVPVAELTVDKGVITHKASNRSTTYGKVAEAAAKLEPPADVKLKDPKDWKIAGKPLKRLDTRGKVDGTLPYSMDFKLPGMLCAAVKESPVFGGKLKSFDAAKIQSMPGVKKVVAVGRRRRRGDRRHLVAGEDRARTRCRSSGMTAPTPRSRARRSPNGSRPASMPKTNFVGNKQGDVNAAMSDAAKKVEAVYAYPFQNHATMEPMNATAVYTPDKCEVWTSSQNAEAAFGAAVQASGLPATKCDVHNTLPRRRLRPARAQRVRRARGPRRQGDAGHADQADQVARRRHDERRVSPDHAVQADRHLRQGQQPDRIATCASPASRSWRRCNPGGDGQRQGPGDLPGPQPWRRGRRVRVRHPEPADRSRHAQPARSAVVLARREQQPERHLPRVLHGRTGACRRPGPARVPPQADERTIPSISRCSTRSPRRRGWGKPAAQGVFRGICQHMGYGSYVAACAEVSVNGNAVKIHRIVAATDCGHAVNPASIERQVPGSFVYGLSALFYGGCTVKDGRIEQSNFDSYDSMRISEMPKVETIVMPSGGFWGGVGEPTIFVAAPAVLNAIFAATGKRYRTIPLRDHDLRLA